MARVPPPEHTRWKKGQSGNPLGMKPLPVNLRKLSPITTEELKRTISKYLRMQTDDILKLRQQLKTFVKEGNPKVYETPALDSIIIATIATAVQKGDIFKAEYLFNRLLGRVTQTVDIEYREPLIIEAPLAGKSFKIEDAQDESTINTIDADSINDDAPPA